MSGAILRAVCRLRISVVLRRALLRALRPGQERFDRAAGADGRPAHAHQGLVVAETQVHV